MNNVINTLSVKGLLNNNTVYKIDVYIEKDNDVYFKALYGEKKEGICGPVKKLSKDWMDIDRKSRELDKIARRKRFEEYEKINCSTGQIKVFKSAIVKRKQQIKRRESKSKIIACGLAFTLGIGSTVIASNITKNIKEKVSNHFNNAIHTVVNKIDEISTSDSMTQDDLHNYYLNLYNIDPNNQAAKNYLETEMASSRKQYINEKLEEESRMLGRK